KGQIHAYDAERARLAPIFDRLKRAGVRNAQAHADSRALAPLEGQMDLVLVDAPCTGSGTWRRRPDAKWRLSEQQLERREIEQREVLDAAKAYVKPGGRLVYITCSLFAPENGDQIAAFLKENGQYRAVDTQPLWNEAVPAGGGAAPLFRDGTTILSPLSTSTDGFFISVLSREK
ncbi:MAG: MFS transporter, partial [Phyllobacterium sp.]